MSIGSLIINYLMQGSVLALSAVEAGKHVPFYWGGAMLGRFIGAYVLRLFSPGNVLASAAAVGDWTADPLSQLDRPRIRVVASMHRSV